MPMQIQSLVRRTVTPSRLLCLPDGVRSSPSPTNSISKVLNPHHGAWSWSKDVRMSVPLSHVYGRVLTSDQKWCTLRTRVGARIAVGTAESALPASARYTQLRAKRNEDFVTQSSLPQVHSAARHACDACSSLCEVRAPAPVAHSHSRQLRVAVVLSRRNVWLGQRS